MDADMPILYPTNAFVSMGKEGRDFVIKDLK
jgi:hypothetical protein